jgi:SAM-dependent methyltransferase
MHLLTFLLLIVLSTSDRPTFPKSLDVPYVPTPTEVVQTMLDMAKVKRGDTVYDLGSGDGRVVVTAARKYGARGLGVDLDPQRIAEARANARRNAVTDRVEFRQGDLFGVDLRKASVLTMYLLPEVNMKLRPRLIEQLRPGTRVVSHNYNLGDWQPDAIRNVGEDHIVYLWIVPARVSGNWRWELPLPAGAQQYSLDVDQHFQQVRGNLTSRSR